MPGPIVHNETTATNLGGFVTILANLTRRAYALEEPPEYVVYQGSMSGESRQFWATVHIYGRGLAPERPYRFTGRTTSFEPQATQLAAREAIIHLRHLSPRVNCRSFHYYPRREGCWKYALEAIIKALLLYFLIHDNCLYSCYNCVIRKS